MTWKVVNIGDAGTASKFGADDTDKINKLLSGTDVDDVDINGDFKFRDGFLEIANPANTSKYKIRSSAISADRDLNLPLITAADTFAVLGLSGQTFTQPQFIAKDITDLLTLRRDINTNGSIWELNFDAKDSGNANQAYAAIRASIITNTAGLEDGNLILRQTIGGTEQSVLEFGTAGELRCGGPNRRIKFSESGLTGTRTYTLPDANTTLGAGNRFSYSFFIYLEGGLYKAKNGITGEVDYSNAALHSVINSILSAMSTNSYTDICIDSGRHTLTDQVLLSASTKSNFQIRGLGPDLTIIARSSSWPDKSMFLFSGVLDGTVNYALASNALKGTQIVTVTTGQSANFAIGDYVKLVSNKVFVGSDIEGEYNRIIDIDTGTGELFLETYLHADFNTADTAKVIKATPMKNITIKDLSITSDQVVSTQTVYDHDIEFNVARNIRIENVRCFDIASRSIDLHDVVGFNIDKYVCENKLLRTDGSDTINYAIEIEGASCNGVVQNCRGMWGSRHFFTTTGGAATNQHGVPRNIVVANNTCYGTGPEAAFDTHDASEGIQFIGNTVVGDRTGFNDLISGWFAGWNGFQIRGKKNKIVGNVIHNAYQRAINIDGDDAIISDNTIINVSKTNTSAINGVNSRKRPVIDNNTIYNARTAIDLPTGFDDAVITNNKIYDCTNDAIKITDCDSVTITGNITTGNNKGLSLNGTTDNCRVVNNQFADNTSASTLVGSSNFYFNNTGITDSTLTTMATKKLSVTPAISPTQITSQQNNYAPTNWNNNSRWRLDGDSSFRTITGIGDTTQTDGTTLILRNISANSILLADASTNPAASSTAGNRMDFNGYDIPLLPKSQLTLIYDGTNSRWSLNSPQVPIIPPPRLGYYFGGHAVNTSTMVGYTSTAASGGSVSNFNGAGIAAHPGVLRYTLGTSTTGSGSLWVNTTASGPGLLGNSWYWRFEAVMKLVALSDGTNRYSVRVGFIDSGTVESADGVFFRYADNVNSGKWERVARNNSTETGSVHDTGSTADTNYHRFTTIVNPAGNLAEFFIDGVSVGTETTNIPTSRATDNGFMFLKSLGTADNAAFDIGSFEVIGYANVSN